MEYLLISVALFLAFGNGANDNFKGFASAWGTASLKQFSGKGLLPQGLVEAPHFLISDTLESITALLKDAGFGQVQHWTDAKNWFAVLWACK